MARPRLRTKTGCNTCRSRRKKCDESKPSCGYCSGRGIDCNWTYTPRASASHHDAPATPRCQTECRDIESPQSPELRFLIRPSSPPDELDFTDRSYHPRFVIPNFLKAFVTPMAKGSFMDRGPWLSIVLNQTWARDATMAFGASWMSNKDKSMVVPCFKFYESAVSGLRRTLQRDGPKANIELCLVTSYFLGLLEVSASMSQSVALL